MDNATTYTPRKLAIVTGASSGIGLELAKLCAEDGYDLVIAADQGPLDDVAATLRGMGAVVDAVCADLATGQGVGMLMQAVGTRPVDALLANAGHGLGHAFLDQDFSAIRHVIDTNITGTLDLIQRVGLVMKARGQGRILVTGSIAGLMPGSFQAVYNGSKAFIDSFALALRNELKDTGITVTLLMPGATDTEFFARAGMTDTKVAEQAKSTDPADVARVGFKAMQDGEEDVVAGLKNKVQAALSNVTPDRVLAEHHRKIAAPGTAGKH